MFHVKHFIPLNFLFHDVSRETFLKIAKKVNVSRETLWIKYIKGGIINRQT